MDNSQKILSNITHHMKYARFLKSDLRRETYEETVTRNMEMHIKKFPELEEEIRSAYKFVYDRKVLPSMRSLQFSGDAITKNNSRIYNCAFAPVDDIRVFSEIMFLLLGGTGVGFSVQKHDIEKLPEIKKPNENRTRRFLVGDSIEGWSDSIKVLMKSYFDGGSSIKFDFSDIRPKGARLITAGGKAPGPQPLKECLIKLEGILSSKKDGEKLEPIEAHDIVCHIADAVLAGGIRRSATISLFSADDEEMLACKSGTWWETNPQRGRANNSVALLRHRITKEYFDDLWSRIKNSGAGEPGIFLTNDKSYGTNPCKPLNSMILTKDGYITFEQALLKESLEVMGIDGEWKKASKPFKTGENRVVSKITLSNGMYLYGTPNHQHMTKEGEWKEIQDLREGDWLKFSNPNIHGDFSIDDNSEYEDGLVCGWLHGDGWFTKRKGRHNSYTMGMCFGDQEFDVIPFFEKKLNVIAIPHAQKPNTCMVFNTSKKDNLDILNRHAVSLDKNDLTWLFGKSKSFKIGFVKALFTADGLVRKQNNCELYSIRRNALEVIQNILNEFGIYSGLHLHNNARSYIAKDGKVRNNKTTFKLNVYAGQFHKIGFLSEIKNNLMQIRNDQKMIYRHCDYVTIVDIERESSVEDVYDITVEDASHAFIDTGVITHNCCEIALRANQMCNLTEVNASDITSQEDFEERVKAASFVGTLQASYTDFHYLRDIWKRTCEKEALIGVGMTGIASNTIFKYDIDKAAKAVIKENSRVSKLIGINQAARTTCVKPSGSSSLILGTSSGVHAWHNDYYIRRLRVGKNEAIYKYLAENHPELIEDEYFRPHDTAIISVPQKAPEGAVLRTESALELLERVKAIHTHWIKPGHVKGQNTHNVSTTVSIQDNEWDEVRDWMWENRDSYSGLSVLPASDHTYKQTPFENCSKEEFERLLETLKEVNVDHIFEMEDETDLQGEIACGAGGCVIS